MADEVYNARVDFQRWLDEQYPGGAWATVVEDRAGRVIPTGIEVIVGRVFCSGARLAEGGEWLYELFLDPREQELQFGEYSQPIRLWVRDIDIDEPVEWDQAEVVDDGEITRVLRIWSEPKGPRVVRPGQREFITELREAELFPRGIELQGVPA